MIATRTHIITSSFGAGKTTAIRRLMAGKPADELWVVILNEFTDAGLDALAVAQSARGRYDVRLVSGGCLCCTGELEFGKQVRDILARFAPARLLIEPSGAAHTRAILDELAPFESEGALALASVVCLVDVLDAERLLHLPLPTERSQIQAADVLLLSKEDLADPASRAAFESLAAEQFPAKAYVGACRFGELPSESLGTYTRGAAFSLAPDRTVAFEVESEPFAIAGLEGRETRAQQLGFTALSWILPPELSFARVVIEPRLAWMLDAYPGAVRRLKGVLRTGPGPSWELQSHGRGLASGESGYRRDSRLEIVLSEAPSPEYVAHWRALLRDAALKRASETSR
jgi:G3E family GTPase